MKNKCHLPDYADAPVDAPRLLRVTGVAAGMGLRAGALLGVGVWLSVVAAAPAATVNTERFPATPVFAGDAVLWTQGWPSDSVELWSAAPGAEPRRVQRIAFPPTNAGYVTASLAASSAFALLTANVYAVTTSPNIVPTSFRYLGGPPAGPLEQFLECGRSEFDRDRPAADVWGEAYVYRQCDGEGGHVEIRDGAAEPVSGPQSVGRGGVEARIAGRFVAWLDGIYTDVPGSAYDLVVYDRVAAAELYRIPRSEQLGSVLSLDVQEDGKVAFVLFRGRTDRRVEAGWASPEEPRVHITPLPPRTRYGVRMAGDRIAYQADLYPGSDSGQDAELGLVDLAGAVTVIARRTLAPRGATESFDYDGERLLWRELGCKRWRLVVRGTADPGSSPGNARGCPLRLTARPTVRRGVATLRFACRPFPRSCTFDVLLRIAGSRTGAGTARSRGNPVRVKLTRAARRRLARRGTLALRVRAWAYTVVERQAVVWQERRGSIRLRPKRARAGPNDRGQ
jgi:hypothetical protein